MIKKWTSLHGFIQTILGGEITIILNYPFEPMDLIQNMLTGREGTKPIFALEEFNWGDIFKDPPDKWSVCTKHL